MLYHRSNIHRTRQQRTNRRLSAGSVFWTNSGSENNGGAINNEYGAMLDIADGISFVANSAVSFVFSFPRIVNRQRIGGVSNRCQRSHITFLPRDAKVTSCALASGVREEKKM